MKNQKNDSIRRRLLVTVMEPTWDGLAHMPANLGLLRVVCAAYPDADVSFVGGHEQIEIFKSVAPPLLFTRVKFFTWKSYVDSDTLPTDVYASLRRLRELPTSLTKAADLIVMSSCTGPILSAMSWMGLDSRVCAMLHGNANEISSWRSHNPLRYPFDMTGALKRFSRNGGRVIVLEERIREQLASQNPWLADKLCVVPHPLLPEEAGESDKTVSLAPPIHIGFLGLATEAKGFPEFVEFANQLTKIKHGHYIFHAIGNIAKNCEHIDQTSLATKARKSLARTEYLNAVKALDFIFVWHKESYYSNAASGVVYDAINLGIPLIARNCIQITEWKRKGFDVATCFDELGQAISAFSEVEVSCDESHYNKQISQMESLRNSLSIPILAATFRDLFPLPLN